MTFPSKPEVTSRRVLVSYSMFFTQLACPCSEHTLEFSFRRSHSAMVVSSEQVANKRLSRNLQKEHVSRPFCSYSRTPKNHKNLMLLTQSSWASASVLMCRDEMGSKSSTSVCSQATVRTDLGCKSRRRASTGRGQRKRSPSNQNFHSYTDDGFLPTDQTNQFSELQTCDPSTFCVCNSATPRSSKRFGYNKHLILQRRNLGVTSDQDRPPHRRFLQPGAAREQPDRQND